MREGARRRRVAVLDGAGVGGGGAVPPPREGGVGELRDAAAQQVGGDGGQSIVHQFELADGQPPAAEEEAADDMDVRVGAGAPLVMARALVAPLDARRPSQRPQQRRLDAEDVGAFEQEAKGRAVDVPSQQNVGVQALHRRAHRAHQRHFAVDHRHVVLAQFRRLAARRLEQTAQPPHRTPRRRRRRVGAAGGDGRRAKTARRRRHRFGRWHRSATRLRRARRARAHGRCASRTQRRAQGRRAARGSTHPRRRRGWACARRSCGRAPRETLPGGSARRGERRRPTPTPPSPPTPPTLASREAAAIWRETGGARPPPPPRRAAAGAASLHALAASALATAALDGAPSLTAESCEPGAASAVDDGRQRPVFGSSVPAAAAAAAAGRARAVASRSL